MTGLSRWAEDDAEKAARKAEKEQKKAAKAEKQRQAEAEAAEAARVKAEQDAAALRLQHEEDASTDIDGRPSKRRRLSPSPEPERQLLRFKPQTWTKTRPLTSHYETLNPIGKGAYGEVTRARALSTGTIVAVKGLESYNPQDGVPITSLREIQTLKESRGQGNIVELLEVVSMKDNGVGLVMEFVEHDLMTLQQDMSEPFLPSEIKTLILQIASALEFLHSHWIMHRDLKTSNILLTNKGIVKLADFGSARFFGDPAPENLTQLVVTLWYRGPELLLGATTYDESVDIWSLGCVLGELLKNEPLMKGKNELDQITRILNLRGLPSEKTWPGFRRLPNVRGLNISSSTTNETTSSRPSLRARFPLLSNQGAELLGDLLSLNPADRPSAAEVLIHPYFQEDPRPKATSMFPTFPSRAQGERRRHYSPGAPRHGGAAPKLQGNLGGLFANVEREEVGAGFSLKVA